MQGANSVCISKCSATTEPSDGGFGFGGSSELYWGGGGGGGYFGGGASYYGDSVISGGGGGSSFVSGCDKCIAYSKESTYSNLIPLDSNIHYSMKYFTDIIIKNGYEEFLDPYGEVERGP